MTSEISYRRAVIDDADAISRLILQSQEKYTFHEYSPGGRQFMRRICSGISIGEYMHRGDVYFVAEYQNEIVGVIGIRNLDHIGHNFVSDVWHKKGISTHLWELARNECIALGNAGSFTLRASTYAIPVYEKWGFVKTGVADSGDVVSTPMRLTIEAG